MTRFALLSLFVLLAACDRPAASEPGPLAESAAAAIAQAPASQPTSQPSSMPSADPDTATDDRARPPTDWIEARVTEARERLAASEAGRLVWDSIEAHGGLTTWFSNGPIKFRFTYDPVDRDPTDTVQTVDTWSARAVHQVAYAPDVHFGWDGSRAWVSDPEAELRTNPRFWALTPYYFVGLPFVLADPGITLSTYGELDFEGRTYDMVRATFGAGLGDAPDDYYILLIDRESRRTGGVKYVVSYPGFFPEGGHTPEKLMVFDGAATHAGITLPESCRTFSLTDMGVEDQLVTNTTISDVSFEPDLPNAAFAIPAGATILEGY